MYVLLTESGLDPRQLHLLQLRHPDDNRIWEPCANDVVFPPTRKCCAVNIDIDGVLGNNY